MGIIAAFLLPHPPIIIPDIGHGEERRIASTQKAYHKVADAIEQLKPDTLVLVSPHAPYFQDAFFLSNASYQSGDFRRFGAKQIHYGLASDLAFVDELAKNQDHLAVLDEADLDHGSLVPLHFILEKPLKPLLVRLGLSQLDRLSHQALGEQIRNISERLNRRVVLIASGDLSHHLSADGPYGFQAEGPKFDQQVMTILASGHLEDLMDLPEELCDKAGECGYRSLLILSGALKGLSYRSACLSYEGPFGVGYGVAQFMVKTQDPYVALARRAIEANVLGLSKPLIDDTLIEDLRVKRGGVFVSLHKKGYLRGCIGTFRPTTDCIAQEILDNAIHACSQDPRFMPVQADELKELQIKVDVLGPIESITTIDHLDVKRYGVIVTSGRRKGLLLPDIEGVDSVDQQISIALKKAGIAEDEPYTLERFEVVRHDDDL